MIISTAHMNVLKHSFIKVFYLCLLIVSKVLVAQKIFSISDKKSYKLKSFNNKKLQCVDQ